MASASSVTFSEMKEFLPQLLKNIPKSWLGTTFKNDHLLLRSGFSEKLLNLVSSKSPRVNTVTAVTEEDLVDVGNAEDYLRVSSNVSATLELVLALERGYSISQVFTFGSTKMPIIAACLVTTLPVRLYLGDEKPPFTSDQLNILSLLGVNLTCIAGSPPDPRQNDDLVLVKHSAIVDGQCGKVVDGIIADQVLYICNTSRIDEHQILIRRKRMATPMTTPVALQKLRAIAGLPTLAEENATAEDVAAFHAHLQQLSGTPVNPKIDPICFTAGLPTIATLWVSLVSEGGADIMMASTAYGGSSQLTDILTSTTKSLKKHKFHLQGKIGMEGSIQKLLDQLASDVDSLMPVTVLFMETPTNPDMKVPDLKVIAEMLTKYQATTKKRLLLLVDATFAPNSHVIEKVRDVSPDLPVIVFLSMSKSVSRGMTTAGTLIFNESEDARKLHSVVEKTSDILDTRAKPNQIKLLVDNHVGVEDRCQKAYEVAVAAGNSLIADVKEATGQEMELAFVSSETAAAGFTTSTFSFNLPAIADAAPGVNEGLAQAFVDHIAKHKDLVKPCVSFGQDNGLIYATVPATSTQGAINEEDKAKQAVGGVQLTRLSFPPTIDVDGVKKIITEAVKSLYK